MTSEGDRRFNQRVFRAIHYASDRGLVITPEDIDRESDYPMIDGMDATAWVDAMTKG